MNHSNIKLSSAIIGTLMILETAFVAVLAVIIVARGGALGHFSSEPFDPSRGHGRLLRDLARHHLRVPVHRRGGQRRAGGRGVAHAAAADPAGHHRDHAAGRGVLDAELVQLRDRACRSRRCAHYVQPGPDHAGPADLAGPTSEAGRCWCRSPGSPPRSRASARRVVRRRADHLTRCPGKASCRSYFTGPAPQVPDPVASRGGDSARDAGVPVRGQPVAGRLRPAPTATSARSSSSSCSSCTSSSTLANIVYHGRFRRGAVQLVPERVHPGGRDRDRRVHPVQGFFVSARSRLPFKTGSSIVWFSLAWAVIGMVWAFWWSRRRRLTSISLVEGWVGGGGRRPARGGGGHRGPGRAGLVPDRGGGPAGHPLLCLHGGPGMPHDYLEPLEDLARAAGNLLRPARVRPVRAAGRTTFRCGPRQPVRGAGRGAGRRSGSSAPTCSAARGGAGSRCSTRSTAGRSSRGA